MSISKLVIEKKVRAEEALASLFSDESSAAQELDIPYTTFRRALRPEENPARREKTLVTRLDQIGEALIEKMGVSPAWWEEGRGPMCLPSHPGGSDIESQAMWTDLSSGDGPGPNSGQMIRVPVAPEGHGAGKGVINDGAGSYIELSPDFIRRLTGGRLPARIAYSFARGDSMEPYLRDGTPILIEEMEEFVDGGRYAVYYDDSEEDEVKRVERLGGRRIRVSSDNRAFPPRVFEHIEDDFYKDLTNGHKLRLRLRGRIIYPPDTAAAIIGELREFAKELLREVAGYR